MVRYPHIATIILNDSTKDANGDYNEVTSEHPIDGRYEPNVTQKNVDYSGKFYCPILDFTPFVINGQKLKYNDVVFEIYQFHNYQNHCELWLK